MTDPREQLSREITPALYEEIRALWKAHSIAEDKRDIAGLMATLTPDCVYEVIPGDTRWEGHAGATRFYLELIGAFPDIHFDLENIVIGPQGVCEEARVSGTHKGRWLGLEPTGERVEFRVIIFFPWDMQRRKFTGERVFALL
ncbi:MAG TPA: ester cyclase [Burkholderiales bacterium]|jgi:predicted ester cyclase|nr:ester cyclase [Burkholderiales bacterium]